MKETYFVANYKGEILGHDLSKERAEIIASEQRELEPDEEWEVLDTSDEDYTILRMPIKEFIDKGINEV